MTVPSDKAYNLSCHLSLDDGCGSRRSSGPTCTGPASKVKTAEDRKGIDLYSIGLG